MAGKYYAVPVLLTVTVAGAMTTSAAANAGAGPLPQAAHAPAWQAQPDTQPPTAPTNLTLTESPPDVITLTWSASTDLPAYPPGPGVVAYEIYASTSPWRLVGVVPATQLTWTDRRAPEITISYHVKARDAAGNVSGPSNIVTRPGRPKPTPTATVTEDPDVRPVMDKHIDKDVRFDDKGGGGHSRGEDEIIKADRFFVHEESDDGHGHHGGGGHHDSYGGHGGHGGDYGDDEAGAYADDGGHGGHGDRGHAEGRPEESHKVSGALPFTGAPVAALAGIGGVLLAAGAAGAVVSIRRRRSAEAR
ncbi:fibronectin type III domain-containing protein [Sphaerisporangium sp. B11E5]|uniref:fibronectin type III domain-containing protein n=1 Tax=Sphaerisporangium sp. B11E5 TaxID=3153563 RepID=UPI00325EC33F